MQGRLTQLDGPPLITSVAADGDRTIISQAADTATILFSLQPYAYGTTEGTDPPIGRWNFAIGSPTDFGGSGTRRDRVLGFGYNFSKHIGGTPTPGENTSDATFGMAFEDFYNINATSLRQFEWYLSTCPAGSDGTDQVRPFMCVVQFPTLASDTPYPGVGLFLDTTSDQGLTLTIDQRRTGTLGTYTSTTAGTMTASSSTHGIATGETGWSVRWANGAKERTGVTIGTVSGTSIPFSGGSGDDLDNSPGMAMYLSKDATWTWKGASSAALQSWLVVSGKSGILFDNGVYALQQKLTNGTAKALMAINAADYLDIGSTGMVKIRSQIIHECTEGVATKYKTSAHTMADSDFFAGSPPVNGTMAISYNGGTSKLWVRTNGTWANPLSW